MKKLYTFLGIILSVCLLASGYRFDAKAAGSGSLKLSNKTGTVGSNVTISGTVTTSNDYISATRVVLSYNQTELSFVSGSSGVSGGSGNVRFFSDTVENPVRNVSFSVTFKILKEGTFSIKFGEVEVISDADMQMMSISKSGGTITGTVPVTPNPGGGVGGGSQGGTTQPGKDSNNKLSSLKVYPGSLSPSFKASVKSYHVTVPKETTKVTISATAQSNKAKVTVSGGNNLQYGLNTAKVVVVAENGASTAYVITIMRGEDAKISLEGVDYTIDEHFTDDMIPEGFTRTKIQYSEREYEALTSAKDTLKLVCLKNATDRKFYIYNQELQEFSKFVLIERGEGKYVIPLSLQNRVDKYKNAEVITVQLQEQEFEAWKLDEEFSLVYAMNQTGDELLYRYDSVEEVFQRYTDMELDLEPAAEPEKLLFPNKYYLYGIAGLGGLCFILFVCIVYFIASRKHRHEARKKKMQRKLEKQKAKEEKQRLKEEERLEKQRIKEEKRLEKQRKKEQ